MGKKTNAEDDVRVNIYKAAIQVFAAKGFVSAKMDDVAEKAGVAKGTLYYHFTNKDAIFSFVAEQGVKEMEEQVFQGIENFEDINSKTNVNEIILRQLVFFQKNQDLFNILLSEAWGAEVRRKILQKYFVNYFRKLEDLLERARSQGYIKEEFDAKTLAGMLFGMIAFPVMRMIAYTGTVDNLDELAGKVGNLIEYGCMKGGDRNDVK